MPITFTKVRLPYGWLGNMSPYPVTFAGKTWPTSEHLFQALRFGDEASREDLRGITSPFGVKLAARRRAMEHPDKLIVQPRTPDDVELMELVLRLKLEQHPDLREELEATGGEEIIEDCTRRSERLKNLQSSHARRTLFWGKGLRDGQWVGENHLGKLWMKLREELRSQGVCAPEARTSSSGGRAPTAEVGLADWEKRMRVKTPELI